MKHARLAIFSLLVLVATIAVAGCKNDRTTDISAILGNPDEFRNHEVLVAGRVTKTYAANLIIAEAGAYQVDDGTGKIWVVTKNGVPEEGQEVGLKGTVGSGLRLGGETFGAILRETERRTR